MTEESRLKWIEELARAYSGDLTEDQIKNLRDFEQNVVSDKEWFVKTRSQAVADLGYTMPETVIDLMELCFGIRARLELRLRKAGYDPKIIQETHGELGQSVFYGNSEHQEILLERGLEVDLLDINLDRARDRFMKVMWSVLDRYQVAGVEYSNIRTLANLAKRDHSMGIHEIYKAPSEDLEESEEEQPRFSASIEGEIGGIGFEPPEDEEAFFGKDLGRNTKLTRVLPLLSFDKQTKLIQVGAISLLTGIENELSKAYHGDSFGERAEEIAERISDYAEFLGLAANVLNGLNNLRPAGALRAVSRLLDDKKSLAETIQNRDTEQLQRFYAETISAHAATKGLRFDKSRISDFNFAPGEDIEFTLELAELFHNTVSMRLIKPLIVERGRKKVTEYKAKYLSVVVGERDFTIFKTLLSKLVESCFSRRDEKGRIHKNKEFIGLARRNRAAFHNLEGKLAGLGVNEDIGRAFSLKLQYRLHPFTYGFRQARNLFGRIADIFFRTPKKDESKVFFSPQSRIKENSTRLRQRELLCALEDLFYEMPKYDFRDDIKDVGKEVKAEINGRVVKMCQHIAELRKLADELYSEDPELAGMYELIAQKFHSDEEHPESSLLRTLTDYEKKSQLYNSVVSAHCRLEGEKFVSGNAFYLDYPNGRKIELLIGVARNYHAEVDKLLIELVEGKLVNMDFWEKVVEPCTLFFLQTGILSESEHPLSDLEFELQAFGVEDILAHRLGKSLREKILFYGDNYEDTRETESLRAGLSEMRGRELMPFIIRRYTKKDRALSRHIARTTSVIFWQPGGIEKKVCTGQYQGYEHFQRMAQKFPSCEIYASGNLGVSFVFDQAFLGFPKVPKEGSIEVLELEGSTSLQKESREFQVDAHETEHVGQVDTPVMWKLVAVSVASAIADIAARKIEKNVFYKDALYNDFLGEIGVADAAILSSSQMKEVNGGTIPKTWQETYILVFNVFMKQSLGEGLLAERMREHGFFEGFILYDKEGKPIEGKEHLKLRENFFEGELAGIELKEGPITDYVNKVYQELAGEVTLPDGRITETDLYRLKNLAVEGKRLREELISIIETTAEVSGFSYMSKYMAGKHGLNENDERLTRDYEEMVRQGKLGNVFYEIVGEEGKITAEMEEKLNQIGMTYRRAVDRFHEKERTKVILDKLGYPSNSGTKIYENMGELNRRMQEYNAIVGESEKLSLRDVCLSMNRSRATISVRYRGHLDEAMKIVEEHGLPYFCDLAENAHSLSDLLAV